MTTMQQFLRGAAMTAVGMALVLASLIGVFKTLDYCAKPAPAIHKMGCHCSHECECDGNCPCKPGYKCSYNCNCHPAPAGQKKKTGQPPVVPAKPVAPEISGIYHGTGILKNADGQGTDRPYRNVVMIRAHKKQYMINWIDGGQGVGLLDGDSLVVAFQQADGGQGSARYRIEVDDKGKPRLVGRWVSNPGNGEVHEESLTFLKQMEEP